MTNHSEIHLRCRRTTARNLHASMELKNCSPVMEVMNSLEATLATPARRYLTSITQYRRWCGSEWKQCCLTPDQRALSLGSERLSGISSKLDFRCRTVWLPITCLSILAPVPCSHRCFLTV